MHFLNFRIEALQPKLWGFSYTLNWFCFSPFTTSTAPSHSSTTSTSSTTDTELLLLVFSTIRNTSTTATCVITTATADIVPFCGTAVTATVHLHSALIRICLNYISMLFTYVLNFAFTTLCIFEWNTVCMCAHTIYPVCECVSVCFLSISQSSRITVRRTHCQ